MKGLDGREKGSGLGPNPMKYSIRPDNKKPGITLHANDKTLAPGREAVLYVTKCTIISAGFWVYTVTRSVGLAH
jgi:hypothetical protein